MTMLTFESLDFKGNDAIWCFDFARIKAMLDKMSLVMTWTF